MRLLCSTGAFSRHPDRCEPSTVAEGIRALGADGIEAIFYTPWYDAIDTAARELRGTGASIPVLHTEKSIGSLDSSPAPEDIVHAAELLRTNYHQETSLMARPIVTHLLIQLSPA